MAAGSERQTRQGAVPLALFTVGMLVCASVLWGLTQRRLSTLGRSDESEVDTFGWRVYWGRPLPRLNLRTAKGARFTSDCLMGNWSVLVFGSAGCPGTRLTLRSLVRPKVWPKHVRVAWVVERAGRDVARVAKSLPGGVGVVVDRGDKLRQRLMRGRLRSPTCVIVSPEGTLCYAECGHRTSPDGEPGVAAVLRGLVNGDLHMDLARAEPAPDGVAIINQRATRLSRLWQRHPVVLTFALPGQPQSRRRAAELGWFAAAREDVQVLFVFPANLATRPPVSEGVNWCRDVDDLAVRYGVRWYPRTFVVSKGRVVWAEGRGGCVAGCGGDLYASVARVLLALADGGTGVRTRRVSR